MSYVIKFSSTISPATYYRRMTAIGPMFGATKKDAMRFETQEDAIRETTRHWGFTTTEIEEVKEES